MGSKKRLAKFYIDTTKSKNPKDLMYNRAEVELGPPIMTSRGHYNAVTAFLREVERLKPGVLFDLKKISEEYTENVRNHFLATDVLYNLGHLWWALVASEDEDCTELGISLLTWADRYNLADVRHDGWFVKQPLYLNIALACITGCIRNGQRYEFEPTETLAGRDLSLVDSVGWWMPNSPDSGKYPFDFFLETAQSLEWRPNESWEEFDGRLNRMYEQNKAAYKMCMESVRESTGYGWISEKRTEYHFTWLAQWQLLGWTQEKIANEHSKIHKPLEDVTTVSKMLRDAAERAMVPLRPAKNDLN